MMASFQWYADASIFAITMTELLLLPFHYSVTDSAEGDNPFSTFVMHDISGRSIVSWFDIIR